MQPDQAGAKVVTRSGSPWISLENITVRLRQRWYLRHTSWEIREGEMWAIVGANGSGKTTLARTLLGEMPVVAGRVVRHYERQYPAESGRVPMAYVAPEQTRQLVARARWQDRLMEFSAGRCRERRVIDLLQDAAPAAANGDLEAEVAAVAAQTSIDHLLDTPVQALSSGETARVLFARALIQGPRLLILDEPFNGLDARARSELRDLVTDRIAEGLKIVLITHRPTELLPAITHLALLEAGKIKVQGPREAVAPLWVGSVSGKKSATRHPVPPVQSVPSPPAQPPLIEMQAVTVSYAEKRVLDQISWAMHPGQHWAIAGPNGAGKTTLLALISGDNLQAYSNEIYLFGRRRGSGESVWEIKKQIGLVTPHFHAGYQKRLTAFEVVCSGWFDSVGLYRRCTIEQKAEARHQMAAQGVDHLAERQFDRLSHGQQRLVLIARALVKHPPLLILDEPCAGLDTEHRRILLARLDAIAAEGASQLLYVTHHPDERPACITHTLRLDAGRVVKIQEHRFSDR